eukprot:TRINITY_DN920_c0_g4_i1.p2 TRINITY_DN920_c0_g4~~TRINITY_DN920_c0_g4_i1.p2  ORF type:complete len:233 (-),score=39.05 TRINITY_DN920_c0_g4_i1:2569-3267(-)
MRAPQHRQRITMMTSVPHWQWRCQRSVTPEVGDVPIVHCVSPPAGEPRHTAGPLTPRCQRRYRSATPELLATPPVSWSLRTPAGVPRRRTMPLDSSRRSAASERTPQAVRCLVRCTGSGGRCASPEASDAPAAASASARWQKKRRSVARDAPTAAAARATAAAAAFVRCAAPPAPLQVGDAPAACGASVKASNDPLTAAGTAQRQSAPTGGLAPSTVPWHRHLPHAAPPARC